MNKIKSAIKFRKERELGEVLSDTFKFVRENYRKLFQVILKYVGPLFLLLILAMSYYTYVTASEGKSLFSIVETSQVQSNDILDFYATILLAAFILLIIVWLYYSILFGTIQYTIKSYIENNGTIKTEEVGKGLKKNWLSFLGLGFVISVLTFIGMMFCFIPGIYIAVPFALVFSIKVFDNLSVSESLSHSFTLIKNNWWISFLTLLLMFVLYYLINVVFQLPAMIYMIIKTISVSKEGTLSDPSFMFDWVYLSLSIISSIIQYLLYTFVVISTVFIYFNLNEKKYHTGTYEEIEELGTEH